MAKFWQSQKFKKLEAKWNEKLQQSKFTDAETSTAKGRCLKQLSKVTRVYGTKSIITIDTKTEYFNLLQSYINEMTFKRQKEVFKNETDCLIMTRRSEGISIQNICKELAESGKKIHRQTVRYIIRNYEHEWGIRLWPKNKLSPPWWGWKLNTK